MGRKERGQTQPQGWESKDHGVQNTDPPVVREWDQYRKLGRRHPLYLCPVDAVGELVGGQPDARVSLLIS